MAATDSRTIRSLDDIELVVDTDVHTSFGGEGMIGALRPYLPEPFDKMLRADVRRIKPSGAYLRPGQYSKLDRTRLTSADRLTTMMEELQSDAVVLVGGPLRLPLIHHEELATAIATAYNDWMLETFLDTVDGCYGAAMVNPNDPEAAAEEIDRRATESAIKAVFVPSGGVVPPLGREQYWPIYEAAEDVGLPVALHGSATGVMGSFPHHWQGTKRYIDIRTVGFPADIMFHLSTLLTQGVPVRYPDLDFVIQEAGLGWIPYFMHRYDGEYSEKRPDAPLLEKRPSDYLREQFYFSSQPVEGLDDPTYVANTIRAFGGERSLMYSSDYPHHDFDHPDEFVRALAPNFEAETIESIFGRNAAGVYDL